MSILSQNTMDFRSVLSDEEKHDKNEDSVELESSSK